MSRYMAYEKQHFNFKPILKGLYGLLWAVVAGVSAAFTAWLISQILYW